MHHILLPLFVIKVVVIVPELEVLRAALGLLRGELPHSHRLCLIFSILSVSGHFDEVARVNPDS